MGMYAHRQFERLVHVCNADTASCFDSSLSLASFAAHALRLCLGTARGGKK